METEHNYPLYIFIAALSFILGWQSTTLGYLAPPDETNIEVQDSAPNDTENHINVEKNTDLDLFWDIWKELETNYVDESILDQENMIYGSIKGMVGSLNDPYTVFMDPNESKEFNTSLEGELEGIGAELTVEEGKLVVVSPLKDSPAEKAGLLPGDTIFLIDDQVASELSLFDAIMNIRGEKGTIVVLTVIREGLEEPIEISIVRAKIDLESVTVENLDNGIVYISVNQFNDKTLNSFNKAISNMLLSEPKGMIIDLRNNGGGYLEIAVDMVSHLLPSGSEAVIIKQRNTEDIIKYTNGNAKVLDVPLVVLVNEGSASASEIVAGAVQSHKRGIMMGTQTFGKGTVQEVEPFSDGSSLRMTIGKWYTPDDRSIDKIGLTPDILVEITDEDIENQVDGQKEAAIDYLLNLKKKDS